MALDHLEVTSEKAFANGFAFGEIGPYRLLEGKVHFTIDPISTYNNAITDLELAPRNSKSQIEFTSDFAMLQPTNLHLGNKRILFDVLNRGRKTVLSGLNSAPNLEDPTVTLESGNGFLMRHGYTIVWCGWQPDVPDIPGLMAMEAPQAMTPDGPVVGDIMGWFQVDHPTNILKLSHKDHDPHPPLLTDDPSATLMVRDHPNTPLEVIDRNLWSFVSEEDKLMEPQPNHIFMPSGFEPGKIYQLVYKTQGSKVVGLGFAAVRDVVSFLKYTDLEAGNPCGDTIEYAFAFGRSQSGRFLRQMIHLGLNNDEEGRIALVGIMALVAGAMRGEFNLRFGQPSKDIFHIVPEMFPCTDTEQTDPITGKTGSLIGHLEQKGQVPKIMFINTSAEYWRGDAALIHTDINSMVDAEESEWVRRYHFSGTQHGSGIFPPQMLRADGLQGQLPFNAINYDVLTRAALVNLDAWVTNNIPPPPSSHPNIKNGTAVESLSLLQKLSRLPGVKVPTLINKSLRLDYGPEVNLGKLTVLPPIEQEQYPALVSDLDSDCNE